MKQGSDTNNRFVICSRLQAFQHERRRGSWLASNAVLYHTTPNDVETQWRRHVLLTPSSPVPLLGCWAGHYNDLRGVGSKLGQKWRSFQEISSWLINLGAGNGRNDFFKVQELNSVSVWVRSSCLHTPVTLRRRIGYGLTGEGTRMTVLRDHILFLPCAFLRYGKVIVQSKR